MPRIRFIATMLVLAGLALIASIVWSVLLIPDLPDPVASHLTLTGTSDGFCSAAGSIAGLSAITAGIMVMFGFISTQGMSTGRESRWLAACGSGTVFSCPPCRRPCCCRRSGSTTSPSSNAAPAIGAAGVGASDHWGGRF